ncbi:MAG: SPOR domain-containing protein [Xanthomonadales bacterium]
MAKNRRKKSNRSRQGTPAWMWLFTGVLIGLGLAWYLFAKGYIPATRFEQPVASETSPGQRPEPAITDGISSADAEQDKPHYDFFTVLPEMKVVVPEPNPRQNSEHENGHKMDLETDTASYLLQVGSFRQASDAEQLKARLALIGIVARIQTVEVNNATWNRVRIGPVSGARKADELRNQLADNGIDSLVMKTP